MNPLVRLGSKKTLDIEDIPKFPDDQSSEICTTALNAAWFNEQKNKPSPHLYSALLTSFGGTLVYTLINFLIYIALAATQPFLVSGLLEYIRSGTANVFGITSGIGISVCMGASAILAGFFLNIGMYYMYCFGMKARSGLMGIIFEQSMIISNSARATHSIGEIITLLSVDVERIWFASLFVALLFLGPVLLLAAIALLFFEIGFPALVVVAFLVVMTVSQESVSRMIGHLRAEIVKYTVERTKLSNEALQGIRAVKMYGWEVAIEKKISAVREKEVTLLKKYLLLKITNAVIPFLAPVLISGMVFISYALVGGEMSVKKTYTVLAILNLTRFPLEIIPLARTAMTEALRASRRLQEFMMLPVSKREAIGEMDGVRPLLSEEAIVSGLELPLSTDAKTSEGQHKIDDDVAVDAVVMMANASFVWDDAYSENRVDDESRIGSHESIPPSHPRQRKTVPEVCLRNVTMSIMPGELVAVVGRVGSGKSTLIMAILNQLKCITGSFRPSSCKVALVSQEHWIQNKSVQDNVIFLAPLVEDPYMDIMDHCQLSSDLMLLPSADITEIGEKGINLSGGQKARVSLARALYADASLYIFDDPLAAVDAHVGKAIFEEAIVNHLHGKARVVVFSSNYHLLSSFDKVVVVDRGGSVRVCENYESLRKNFPEYCSSAPCEAKNADLNKPSGLYREKSLYRDLQRQITEKRISGASELIGEEDRERGHVTLSTFNKYFSAAMRNKNGLVVFGGMLLIFAVGQCLRVLVDLWFGWWARDLENHRKEDDRQDRSGWVFDLSGTYSYVQVYNMCGCSIVIAGTCVFVIIRSLCFLHACVGASYHIHRDIMSCILGAPIPMFFDITPIGRIMNRLTKDLDAVDNMLPEFFLQTLQNGFHVFSVFILCVVSSPYVIVILLPLCCVFYFIQHFFRKTSRELKRLDGVSRSPIYNHFEEMLAGLTTIRAFKKEKQFRENHYALCDDNKRCFYAYNITNRWLSVRLEFVSASIAFFVSLIAVMIFDLGGSVDVQVLGLAIVYSLQLVDMLQWTVRMVLETENSLTSVERLLSLTTIPQESPSTDNVEFSAKNLSSVDMWPSRGSLRISNLSLRYREGLPLVLNKISLDIPGGHKVGIVGRTGAGKSSIALCLLRLVEPLPGSCVEIDGVSTLDISLKTLRAKVSTIPQEPVMFCGTIRYNLDPFDDFSDLEIWEALERVSLKDDVVKYPLQLNHLISERGENISMGQRQLLCIARALLRRSRVIIMDEATASVDNFTDQKIQKMMRTVFEHCTVLTIAHRLNTIMDFDMIVVMENGRVGEVGAPNELLQASGGLFSSLVKELGGG